MKKLIVKITDDTTQNSKETVAVNHLSDLGDGIKEAVDDFVKENEGVVLPPVSITVTESKLSPAEQNHSSSV